MAEQVQQNVTPQQPIIMQPNMMGQQQMVGQNPVMGGYGFNMGQSVNPAMGQMAMGQNYVNPMLGGVQSAYDPRTAYNYNFNLGGYNIPPQFIENALTPEEMAQLKRFNQAGIDITVDPDEILRAMCTHKQNGQDVVQQINDGTGDVYCPICGERWNPSVLSDEELSDLINTLVAQMQIAKWFGNLPISVAREYFQMIPLLKKFNNIMKFATNNFNRMTGGNIVYDAGEQGAYNALNIAMNSSSFMNPYMPYGVNNMMIGQQQMVNPQQMQMMGGQMMGQDYGAPTMYSGVGNMPQQATTVNPMQIQYPSQPMMMGGGIVQPSSYVYTPGQPVAAQQPAAQPQQAQQVVQPQADNGTVTTTQKYDV